MLACCVAMPGSVGIDGFGGSMVVSLAGDAAEWSINFDSRAPGVPAGDLRGAEGAGGRDGLCFVLVGHGRRSGGTGGLPAFARWAANEAAVWVGMPSARRT